MLQGPYNAMIKVKHSMRVDMLCNQRDAWTQFLVHKGNWTGDGLHMLCQEIYYSYVFGCRKAEQDPNLDESPET